MASKRRTLSCDDYHIAWFAPTADLHLLPARLMLDEEYLIPSYATHYDENTYICGSIYGHAVVIATCAPGEAGYTNASSVTASMFETFPNIRLAMLVGIGGGIPRQQDTEDALEDIHLGDVVVGWPSDGKPACVYHDRGGSVLSGFELMAAVQDPDWRLTNALALLQSDHELGQTSFDQQLARLQRSKRQKQFAHPGLEHDKLFKASYQHNGNATSLCDNCDSEELVQRALRGDEERDTFVFHLGRIVTTNSIVQSGELRDQISSRYDGALCVESEAAGADSSRRYLVIRGVSDYADSHRNDLWRSCAAGKAAAFTRELLRRVQPSSIIGVQPSSSITGQS